MPPIRRAALALLAALSLASALACGPKKKPQYKPADEFSGEDAQKAGAVKVPVNQVVVDSVDYDKQDTTDWKSADLVGSAGVVRVELQWDENSADVLLDLYDNRGNMIAASPAMTEPQKRQVLAQIDHPPQTVFIRVRAAGPGSATSYSLTVHWKAGS